MCQTLRVVCACSIPNKRPDGSCTCTWPIEIHSELKTCPICLTNAVSQDSEPVAGETGRLCGEVTVRPLRNVSLYVQGFTFTDRICKYHHCLSCGSDIPPYPIHCEFPYVWCLFGCCALTNVCSYLIVGIAAADFHNFYALPFIWQVREAGQWSLFVTYLRVSCMSGRYSSGDSRQGQRAFYCPVDCFAIRWSWKRREREEMGYASHALSEY